MINHIITENKVLQKQTLENNQRNCNSRVSNFDGITSLVDKTWLPLSTCMDLSKAFDK